MTGTQDNYRSHGSVLLPSLFPREIVDALVYQISLQVAADPASVLRPGGLANTKPCYEASGMRWPVLATFLWALTPRIRDMVGAEVLPTYSYFRTYQQSDVCRVHTDRNACEHSLSLTLGYADGRPWALSVAAEPIEIGVAGSTTVANDFGAQSHHDYPMAPGDAVLYRGISHRHGRLLPNPNRWSAHLFMHWIERDGNYRNCAFDGRSFVGKPDFLLPP